MRYIFGGFQGLSRALERVVIEEPIIVDTAMGMIAKIVERNVKKLYGDATRLEALSDVTQADRESLGYSANEPLLRDGTLLRDSVFSAHSGPIAEVGSNEPIAEYHERGFVNARAGGQSVPPRPVFRYGLEDSEKEIGVLFEGVGEVLFNGKRVA